MASVRRIINVSGAATVTLLITALLCPPGTLTTATGSGGRACQRPHQPQVEGLQVYPHQQLHSGRQRQPANCEGQVYSTTTNIPRSCLSSPGCGQLSQYLSANSQCKKWSAVRTVFYGTHAYKCLFTDEADHVRSISSSSSMIINFVVASQFCQRPLALPSPVHKLMKPESGSLA